MQQNIKVDVIYYLSPSDFEMEFNLCGCCHMRLLNEKTRDRKELVKALAKAVSRSKIMILCGPLFDDNGLINIVSTAIGKSTEIINNAEFGINYDDKINIIEGSIPLVTPDGIFGGCIIESGPQAIVVLSENKSVRKTIMNNLIHQYIYELSLLPENALTRDDENSETVEEAASEATATETVAETQAEEKVEEQEQDEEPKGNIEYEDISSVSDQAEETVEAEQEETEPQSEEIQTESEEETEYSAEEEMQEQPEFEQQFGKKIDNGKALFSFADEEETEQPEDLEDLEDLEVEQLQEVEENCEQPQKTEESHEQVQDIEMFINPHRMSPKKVTDYAKNYVPSEKDGLFIAEEDYEYDYDIDDEDENFHSLPKRNLSIILILILLSLIIVVLLYLMVYIPYSKGIDYATYIEQIFGPASNI